MPPKLIPAPVARPYFTLELTAALAYAVANPALDPQDAIVGNHPELFDYDAIALPGMTCGESALRLAMAIEWWDRNKNKPRKDWEPVPILQTGVQGPLSMLQMARRLLRLSMLHFPMYWYAGLGADGLPSFTLESGKPRADNWAIVLIPAIPGQFLVAHWTVTTVAPPPPAALPRLPAIAPTVVYSAFPLCPHLDAHQPFYWRAKVCPENAVVFSAARQAGLACSCPWVLKCDCEKAYRLQHVAHGVLPSVTLRSQCCIEGSAIGLFRKSISEDYALKRVPDNGVKVRHHSTEYRESFVFGCPTISSERFFNLIAEAFGSRSLQAHGTCDEREFYPYRLAVYTYLRPVEHQTVWTLFKDVALTVGSAVTPFDFQREYEVEPVPATEPWGETADLTLNLPRESELLQRLAVRKDVTHDCVIDTVRRLAHEEKWECTIDRDELEIWLKRVITVQGEKAQPMLPPLNNGQCWSCCKKVKTYRHMCKGCKRGALQRAPERPISDAFATHVGFYPLWSQLFTLPKLSFKRGTKLLNTVSGKLMKTRMEVDKWLARQQMDTSRRGQLCGPMFANQVPKCFPRGTASAVSAFLVRLGGRRPFPDSVVCGPCASRGLNECSVECTPDDELIRKPAMIRAFDLLYRCFEPFLDRSETGIPCPLEPESKSEFLGHFSGDKRTKMEEALRDYNEGFAQNISDGQLRVKFKGFTKAEKSYDFEWGPDGVLHTKPEAKPRFICSPNPIHLYRLGRITHRQTKWLASRFTCRSRMFYAGCATPDEMNAWLNFTAADAAAMNTIVDDVSAMDSSFTFLIMRWHERVRRKQFPHMGAWEKAAFKGEEAFWIRIGDILAFVMDVNASGVSDTSYKNTAPCLPLRVLAIIYAAWSWELLGDELVVRLFFEVLEMIYTSASGDDGLTRVPPKINGVDTGSEAFLKRYSEAWSLFGFSVKATVVPPNRWRMATYLAQRPVWNGFAYEWAPEPARRLRGIFWQIDTSLHPIAWGRGVATQLLIQARALPVVSDVCEWYLRVTKGPVLTGPSVMPNHEYSPFYGAQSGGAVNPRCRAEFCLDYGVSLDDLDRFVRMLDLVPHPLVNLNSFVLDRIYHEES